MDTLTENSVMETIRSLSKHTIIMIAHRLTTIRDCDVIYMLEDGMIVGSGNFKELSSKNEKFRKMVEA